MQIDGKQRFFRTKRLPSGRGTEADFNIPRFCEEDLRNSAERETKGYVKY
jgi:hypothetical protein